MTVKEFYQYCEERGLLDHKITYNISDGLFNCEKDLEECDIEEFATEIFIIDHSMD